MVRRLDRWNAQIREIGYPLAVACKRLLYLMAMEHRRQLLCQTAKATSAATKIQRDVEIASRLSITSATFAGMYQVLT
jgi:hypothetical protein